MGRKAKWPPTYRRHAKGYAFIRFQGHDIYLGPVDSPESRAAYTRKLAEIEAAGGREPPPQVGQALTVRGLVLRFLLYVKETRVDAEGKPTYQYRDYKNALRPAVHLYRDLPATAFDSVKLEAVQRAMVHGWKDAKGKQRPALARKVVNHRLKRIVRCFRWAATKRFVPTELVTNLALVEGLRQGQRLKINDQWHTPAEYPDIGPVPIDVFERTLPLLTAPVRAMALLQRYTGMRPGEVCILRPRDVQKDALHIDGVSIWVYRPGSHLKHGKHKGAHHEDGQAQIALGPKAQEVLTPFLEGRDPDAYCFSPADSKAEFLARRRAARKFPLWPSHLKAIARRRKREPKRRPGLVFTPDAYGKCIDNVVRAYNKRADTTEPIPLWHPHQIRHLVGTEAEETGDLDQARARLRHKNPMTTVRYSKAQLAKAAAIVAKIG